METFSTAAAETEAPRPFLQIAHTNNPIETRTILRRHEECRLWESAASMARVSTR